MYTIPKIYLNSSFSHGTMRAEHVANNIKRIIEGIPQYKENTILKRIVVNCNTVVELINEGEQSEADFYLNEDIWHDLNGIAPRGYYFGAHQGDGSDYGFWKHEEIDEEVYFTCQECGEGKPEEKMCRSVYNLCQDCGNRLKHKEYKNSFNGEFHCPRCKKIKHLDMITESITKTTRIDSINVTKSKKSFLSIPEPSATKEYDSCGVISGFQCSDCGYVLVDEDGDRITNDSDLLDSPDIKPSLSSKEEDLIFKRRIK